MTTTQNVLTDSAFATAAGSQSLNSLASILGPPRQSVDLRSVGSLAHEAMPLAKAFEGRSKFLQHVYSTYIGQTMNEFMTRRILPLVYRDDEHFHIHYTEFLRTLAPQTPVYAPTTNVRSTEQRREFHMQRHSLGTYFGVEAGKTKEGRFLALGNLMNVAVSFGDTMQYNGIITMLSENDANAHFGPLRRKRVTNVVSLFDWRKKVWDSWRKSERGFDRSHDEVKKAMSPVVPSDVIVPPFTSSLIAGDHAEQEVFRAGQEARDNVLRGGDAVGVRRGDLLIHATKEYPVNGNNGELLAPLKRVVPIGDHFDLTDHLEGRDPHLFRSTDTDIKVFDMSCGDGQFRTVTKLDVLRNCGRFEDDGEEGALSRSHYDLAQSVEGARVAAGLQLEDGFADMFLYSAGNQKYQVCSLLGHMEEKALSRTAVRETALTVAARIAEQLAPGDEKAILDGIALIDRIYLKTPTAADFAFATAVVDAAPSAGEGGVLGGNEFGAHEFPTALGVVGENYLPFGFGSQPGLRTIGALSNVDAANPARLAIGEETIGIARRFNEAFPSFAEAAASLFVASHPAFDADLVPKHFESNLEDGVDKRRTDALITFATNLLDHNKLPLYVTDSVGGSSFDVELVGFSNATEGAAVNAIRKAISLNVTPLLRQTFGTTEAAEEFIDRYSKSRLSTAFAQSLGGSSRGKRTLSTLFANVISARASQIAQPAERSRTIATFTSYLIQAVNGDLSVEPSEVQETLNGWFVTADPELQAALDAIQRSSNNQALSRLVAPLSVMRTPVAQTSGFRLASPFDSSQVINTSSETQVQQAILDSRGDLQAAFIGSRAYPEVWGYQSSDVGSKRSFSGAFENRSVVGGQFSTNGYIQLNYNLLQRFRQSRNEEKNVFQRVARQLVLLTPIKWKSFELFYERNVRIPFDGRGSRPLRRYQTASAIYVAVSGTDFGETAWTNLDVMLEANASNKTINVHVTLSFVPIVKKPNKQFVLRDCVVVDYHGGESLAAYTPETFIPSNEDSGRSVIYELQPAGSLKEACPTSDIRGRFSNDLIENSLTQNAYHELTRKPLTPSALFTNFVWDLAQLRIPTLDDYAQFSTEGQHNSVTHRTMTWRYNPSTGDYSNKLLNTGYFGADIYDGHGALRVSGSSQHYRNANYLSSYAPM